jgi:RNA polymerase sigma-70 factor, ECF subfamily
MEPSATDCELLRACRAGDRDAFGVFYVRHRYAVLAYFARRVGQREVAADLMAEAFASALVMVRSDGPVPETPVAWLFTTARNLLVDALRRGRVEAAARRRLALEPLVLEDEDIARIGEIEAAVDLVERVRPHLTEAEWATLQARVLDGEPYPSLAVRLRCSEAVVRKRVSRAKAHLRSAIGESNA